MTLRGLTGKEFYNRLAVEAKKIVIKRKMNESWAKKLLLEGRIMAYVTKELGVGATLEDKVQFLIENI